MEQINAFKSLNLINVILKLRLFLIFLLFLLGFSTGFSYLSIDSLQFKRSEFLEFSTNLSFDKVYLSKINLTSLNYTLIRNFSINNSNNNTSYLLIGSNFLENFEIENISCSIFKSSKSQLVFGGFSSRGESFNLALLKGNKTIFNESFIFEDFPEIEDNESFKVDFQNNSYFLRKRNFGFCNFPSLLENSSLPVNQSNMFGNYSLNNSLNISYEENIIFNNSNICNNTQINYSSTLINEGVGASKINILETSINISKINYLKSNLVEVIFTISRSSNNSKRAAYFYLNKKKIATFYLKKNSQISGRIFLNLDLPQENEFAIKGLGREFEIDLFNYAFKTNKSSSSNNLINNKENYSINDKNNKENDFFYNFSNSFYLNDFFFLPFFSNREGILSCSLYLYNFKKKSFDDFYFNNFSLILFENKDLNLKNSDLYSIKCTFSNLKNSSEKFNEKFSSKLKLLNSSGSFKKEKVKEFNLFLGNSDLEENKSKLKNKINIKKDNTSYLNLSSFSNSNISEDLTYSEEKGFFKKYFIFNIIFYLQMN